MMNDAVPLSAVRVRNLIRAAEAKSDEALQAKLVLMQGMLSVRQSEEVAAPHIGQSALLRLGRSIQNHLTSQTELFRCHNGLTEAGREIFGYLPEETPTMSESEELDRAAA